MSRAPLRQVQEWFATAIMHPGSLAEGVRIAPHAERFVADGAPHALTAGPLASAMGRLAIYHHGYQARLVECLADDYPVLRDALGEDAFDALCRDYIAAHPSQSPNLNGFGRHMATFAAAHGGEHAAFASELATLEWAIVEAIHAADAETLSLDALQSVAPERWANARLLANRGVRVLRFEYPVNWYFQAMRRGENPAIPATERSVTAVYRQNYVVWRMDLTAKMVNLLESLYAGATLEQGLASVPELEADEVVVWFRDWVAAGFFSEIDIA